MGGILTKEVQAGGGGGGAKITCHPLVGGGLNCMIILWALSSTTVAGKLIIHFLHIMKTPVAHNRGDFGNRL